MINEIKEKEKIQRSKNDLIFEAQTSLSSYMTKEEFLTIINNLDFQAIKYADIKFITNFIIDFEEQNFKMLTKDIEIR